MSSVIAMAPLLAQDHPMIFKNVPLMPGLKVIDRHDGSQKEVAVYIVVAEASGNLAADDLYDYYEYNLQKLHWEMVPGRRGTFMNSAEELLIIPQTSSGELTVTFKLRQ